MATIEELEATVEKLRHQIEAAPGAVFAAAPGLPAQPALSRRGGSLVWRHRNHWKPLASLAVLEGAGGILHQTGLGAASTVAGLGTGIAWWYLRGRNRIDRAGEQRYALGCWLAASGWLGMAGSAGVTHVDTLLWTAGPALAVPWWLHHRLRPHRRPQVIDAEPGELDWREQLRAEWAVRVACPGGPLPGSILFELEEIRGGWRAVISELDGTSDDAVAAVKRVGARLRLRVDEINIEPSPRGLHQAVILVQPDNPLKQERYWTGPTLDKIKGLSVIGVYGDGSAVTYRHWRPGAGGIHTLIAGTNGAGKSELAKMLLAEERHSGMVVSYLIDPQRGQSYSGWKRSVHKFASNIEEARALLFELRRRMYGRNSLLSSIEWIDEKKRLREGIEDFAPLDVRHGLPLISVTIDEAQVILADPVCCQLVAEMIAMSRKCGIKFRLMTQVPLQDSLGNSQEIKDAVASGNVIVFRTANSLSGMAAFNGHFAFDPCELPKEWPDGSTTSGLGYIFGPGADRPSTMRTLKLDDSYRWATTGTPVALDDVIEPEPEQDVEPEPGKTTERFALLPGGAGQAAEEELLAADHVLGWFGICGEVRETAEIVNYFIACHEMADRTVRKALTDLVSAGHLHRPQKGRYIITPAGQAELQSRTA